MSTNKEQGFNSTLPPPLDSHPLPLPIISLEYSRQKVGNWAKFCLLMWKNMLLVWRRKYATVFEVLTPVAFAALLVLVRGLRMPESFPVFEYGTVTPIYNAPWNATWRSVTYNLAYTPPHPALDAMMAQVKASMDIQQDLRTFPTEAALNQYLIDDQSRSVMLAGLIFEGFNPTSADLPNDLHVRIRFPAESRALANRNPLTNNWQTDALFPLFSTGGPRNQFDDNGGNPPGYADERFMTIQSAISQAFIEARAAVVPPNESSVLRTLLLNRFPDPEAIVDGLLFVLQLFVPLIMFLGFLYPAINNVKVGGGLQQRI